MKQSVKTTADPLSELSCEELLEILRRRGKRIIPHILRFSGSEITTTMAAKRLNKSPERVRQLIRAGRLVGHTSSKNRRRLMLPEWQFRERGEVHKWVPELIRTYGSNGWSLMHFVAVPRISLAGKNYLRQLKRGRECDVLVAARRANPD